MTPIEDGDDIEWHDSVWERGRRLFRRCLLGRKSSDDLFDHASFVLLLSLNSARGRATCCLAGIPHPSTPTTTQLKFENVVVVGGSIRKSDSWHASKYRYKFLPPSLFPPGPFYDISFHAGIVRGGENTPPLRRGIASDEQISKMRVTTLFTTVKMFYGDAASVSAK